MLMRLLAGGLIAGFVTGIVAALLHFVFVQEIILQAELYESGELVHFQDTDHSLQSDRHAEPDAGHGGHGHGAGGDDAGMARNLLTVLFAGMLYAGYGLLLAAAYQVARSLGYQITLMQGILWGVAGFATFQMAPAMGLSPELPGTIGPDTGARQIWWFGTVAATGAGLAIMAYGRQIVHVAIGVVLIAVPHLIGAPVLDTFYGSAPPEMAGEFSARVLGVGLVAWVVLGCLTAQLTASGDDAAA